MGIISRIRNNTGLLIGAIGIGVAGFIIMDMSGNQDIRGQEFNVATVNGEKISLQEFRATESILYSGASGDTYAQKDYLYDYFVEKALLEQEAEELGLSVGKEELIDLQFGTRLSPIISQRFTDPQTGQVSRAQLTEYQQQIQGGTMDPTLKAYWSVQEKEIIKARLESKLANLTAKSMYTPNFVARKMEQDQNTEISALMATVPYSAIPDSEAEVTDNDIEEFIKLNKSLYSSKKEERNITYVVFDVIPSAKDSMEIREQLTELKAEFEITENDSLFVVNNYGTYTSEYVLQEDISPAFAELAFSLPIGSVYGPYKEGNNYRVSKVLDRMIIPDSVQSRHILLTPKTQEEAQAALARLDSIKTAIESGGETFAAMARKYSKDGSAASGGDLGYAAAGMMVKPFNDLIFFKAKEGELNLVGTDFGFHLVEVTGKKFITKDEGVKIAYLNEAIVPSSRTQDEVRDQALNFIDENPNGEALKAAAKSKGMINLSAKGIVDSDHTIGGIGQGGGVRNMVQWLFDGRTEIGDVSPDAFAIQNQGDFFITKYIVASMDGVKTEGEVTVDNIREEVTPVLRNQKKAEILNNAIKGKGFNEAVSMYNAQVDTLNNINFANMSSSKVQGEGKLVGAIFKTEVNSVSRAVAGNSGILFAMPTSKNVKESTGAMSLIKQTNNMSARNMASNRLLNAMVESADINDQRTILY